MQSVTSNWRIPPWAWLPIGAAITAESVSNALRAYGLGQHLDRFTVTIWGVPVSLAGSVLVLAAVAISLSQARAAWLALTPNPLRQRIVAGVAAALLLAVSVTAMASHILEAQRAKVADEGGARGAYDRAEAAYGRAAAELEALGNPRPVSVIQADVRNFKIDAGLWSRSKQCEDATKPDTQTYCEPILALYKERGAAARKTELEPEVARLRDQLASLHRPEVETASEAVLGGYWPWVMGVAVVFVATFGTVIFARPTTRSDKSDRPGIDVLGQSDFPALADHPALNPEPAFPGNGPPKGGRRGRKSDSRIVEFSDAYSRKHGRAPSGSEIRAQFPDCPRSTAYDYSRRARA